MLKKIPKTSLPSEDVQIEWYISTLPSNIVMFIDRDGKITLSDDMKEALSVEKIILALEKKTILEERKSKKVTFKGETKKKPSKDPFSLEGLQKFLKMMSKKKVEINKQVSDTSKRHFRPFKKAQSSSS